MPSCREVMSHSGTLVCRGILSHLEYCAILPGGNGDSDPGEIILYLWLIATHANMLHVGALYYIQHGVASTCDSAFRVYYSMPEWPITSLQNSVPEWLTTSVYIIACQNGPLHLCIIACQNGSLLPCMYIIACQNGPLHLCIYIACQNSMPEWPITSLHNSVPEWLTTSVYYSMPEWPITSLHNSVPEWLTTSVYIIACQNGPLHLCIIACQNGSLLPCIL